MFEKILNIRSSISMEPIFHLRPSWNTMFSSTINLLKLGGTVVPRNVTALRFLTDMGIPKWLPFLSSGVISEPSQNPPGEWFYPSDPSKHNNITILYLHGGAFSCCNSKTHRLLLYNLAEKTKSFVLSVDYRRPPEFPYPIPIDDCVSAYEKLLEFNKPTGKQIFLAGDSAGGNLVVSTLLKIEEKGLQKPNGGILISPWIDLTDIGRSESWKTNKKYDYIPKKMANLFANCYLGKNPYSEENPYTMRDLSPHYSDKLHTLPPLLIEFGECEVLHDQILSFCNKLKSLGNNVTYNIRNDMVHVFPMYAFTGMAQCEEFFNELNNFLTTTTTTTTTATSTTATATSTVTTATSTMTASTTTVTMSSTTSDINSASPAASGITVIV